MIKAIGKTDVGQVRSINQDTFLINEKDQLFVVADGMGGHAGGEIASKMCVQLVNDYLETHVSGLSPSDPNYSLTILNHMRNAINYASAKIYEHALEEPSLRGMGTTATSFKLIHNLGYWAHVGDSRLYLLRSGFLYQITDDHSLVNEQIRAGVLSEEDAETHHLRNVITRSVGYQEEEDVDAKTLEVRPGDYLILCSDGLHGKVSREEIAAIIAKRRLNAASDLIDLANRRGGDDNITVIVGHVQEEN